MPLFPSPPAPWGLAGERGRVAAPRVVATSSRLLFDTLAGVYADLGFDVLGDETFRDLVIARIVEPTSILDAGRVLTDLGRPPASEKTMRRTLARCVDREYRDKIADACFAHALSAGDVSLVLYDVTTLYFEAEKEDDLRKVGYSKERRVDPQIVVGLLVDRTGFPLEIGCYEGNKAETATIIPIVKQFADGTAWPTWSSSPMPGCCPRATCASSTKRACGSSSAPGSPRHPSIWPRTSAGTATRSPTGSSSTPSPRRTAS